MKTTLSILAIILLASCNHLEKGTVLKKHYEPEHSYVSFIPIMTGKTTILVPYIVTDNEDYVLTIEGFYNKEVVHETVYVSKQCYESLNSGDLWVKDQYCSFTDNNNSKVEQ